MNEVTQIHLGRQSFTISVAAHKELQIYLKAIEQNGGKDVAEEVELRMVELLTEQGVEGDKVVLEKDVKYLKSQLGEPKDFTDEREDDKSSPAAETQPKRLFRDTQNGMLAGIAAGIAAYLNIDPVIIRLLFIVTVLTGGWGIPLYIVLWLILPEAKTTSDQLQMRGKAVTIVSLKEVIDRADIPGAATRASNKFGTVIEQIGRVILALAGSFIAVLSCLVLFALMVAGIYTALHHGAFFRDNWNIFPSNGTDIALVALTLTAGAILAVFGLLIGVAMARRKWQLPAWGVAALLGIFMLCAGTGAALAPDVAHGVEQRYRAAQHSEQRRTEKFTKVEVAGGKSEVTYTPAADYSVEVRYIGDADTRTIKTSVNKAGVLTIDTNEFYQTQTCDSLCLFSDHHLEIIVHAPTLPDSVDGQSMVIPGVPYDWHSGMEN